MLTYYTSSKNIEVRYCSNKMCPPKIFIQNGNIIKRHGMLQTLTFISIKYVNIKLYINIQ